VDYKEINFSELTNPFLETASKKKHWFRVLNKGIEIQLPDVDVFKLFIRWMHYHDVPTVCNIERQIFPSPWPVEGFLYELENRDYNISMVGLIGEKLVTYAISYLMYDEIHISNLAVAPEFRRLKIGETMVGITLRIGRERNCKQAHLEVRESNVAAISLYEKFGFKLVNVRKNYYQNEKENALLMSRTLDVENIHGVVQTR
jgi:ribosomal-protein-alanine N-acetyltransferase